MKKKTFTSWKWIGQSYFNNNGAQLYLIFQPIHKTITTFSGLPGIISEWESKGLSNETFMLPFTSNKSISPKLVWMNNSRIRLEFKGTCLKQEKAPFTPNDVVILYIVFELNILLQDFHAEYTVKDCFFGTVKLTKNVNPNKFSYSWYGIGFDSSSFFSIPNLDHGENVLNFGVDMSLSVHANNKIKNILFLDKGQIRELDNTLLTINFSRSEEKFCVSLSYNGSNSFLFFNSDLKQTQRDIRTMG